MNLNIIRRLYDIAGIIENSGTTPSFIGLAAKMRYRLRNSPTVVFDQLIPLLLEYRDSILNKKLTPSLIKRVFGLDNEYTEVLEAAIKRGDDLYILLNEIIAEVQL